MSLMKIYLGLLLFVLYATDEGLLKLILFVLHATDEGVLKIIIVRIVCD
jgi:hypothetical protein